MKTCIGCLLLWASVLPSSAQNTTLVRTVSGGNLREQIISHQGQDPDTDSDGVSDRKEVALGSDPAVANDNFVQAPTWLVRNHESGNTIVRPNVSEWHGGNPTAFSGEIPGGPVFDGAEYQIIVPAGTRGIIRWLKVTTVEGPETVSESTYDSGEWHVDSMISPVFQLPAPSIPGDGYYTTVTLAFMPQLFVDANRDGEIKSDGSDATSSDQPFRFWVNDDDDDGDTGGSDIPGSGGNGGPRIDGRRDLIDFFPLFLDLGSLLNVLPSSDETVVKLKQQDSAVRIVWTELSRERAFEYLKPSHGAQPPSRGYGSLDPVDPFSLPPEGAIALEVSPAGVALPREFINRIRTGTCGVLLVSGIKASAAPLVLSVEHAGALIVQTEFPLKISPVEDMYHYLNVRHMAPGGTWEESKRGPQWGTSQISAAPNDPFAGVSGRKNTVFLHGYNVNGQQARGTAAEMFKRLYWAGSKAKFYAVLWRGDDSQGAGLFPDSVTPDYHVNVGHALQTAPLVRGFLESLAPTPTVVVAHSLGNLVAAHALTHRRDTNVARVVPAGRPAHVVNYFALNAAVPLEAFDPADRSDESRSWMPHPSWAGYDERLLASDWHALFANTEDARQGLTWLGLLGGVDIGVNFYSSGEEVLDNPADGSVPALQPALNGGQYAWIVQEKFKGRTTFLPLIAFRSNHGGWGFDEQVPPTGWQTVVDIKADPLSYRQREPDEAREADVATSALPSRPFFLWFQSSETDGYYPGYNGARLRAPIGDADADDEARKHVTRAKLLAEAIPALSYAMGRNSSKKFSQELSQDMNNENTLDGVVYRTGWPAERNNRRWRHSDFREVAYYFVHPLLTRIVDLGGLKP